MFFSPHTRESKEIRGNHQVFPIPPHAAAAASAPNMAGSSTKTQDMEGLPSCFGMQPATTSSPARMTPLSSDMPDPQRPVMPFQMHSEIRVLLRALPTHSEIESLLLQIEETHCWDLQAVQSDVQALSEKMHTGETAVSALETRVSSLESACNKYFDTAITLQLHLEDLEDRIRRNNLRFRGIPEATGREDLRETVTAIFQKVLGSDPPEAVELDRVHMALGPRCTDLDRPRDVVCRVHHFLQKEAILCKAWDLGTVDFDGAAIKIVSKATLQHRALLRPVLDFARRAGCTYRWGYPWWSSSGTTLPHSPSGLLQSYLLSLPF